jgi:type IV secretion system protein VirB8
VTRYLLMHYVTTCERYIEATAEQDYSECGTFHSARRNQEWAAHWARANPDSPLNRFRDGSSQQADIKAISFFQRGNGTADLAQVRYAVIHRDTGGAEVGVTHWIVTIQYTYAKPSTDPQIRRWNPLGFRVLDFHAEPELPDAPPATAAATVATTGSAP